MGFFDKLKERSRHKKIAAFAPDEKRALLRLAYAVAVADGDVGGDELDAAKALAVSLGVDFNDATKLGLPEAIAILQAQPAKLELSCLVVADIVFADGDYDASERKFVEDFATRFKLPKNTLQEAADRLAKQKVDAALDQWHHEIVKDR